MKMHIRICAGDQILAFQKCLFKFIGSFLQLGKLGICDVVTGILHCQLFQCRPHLQHIFHILTGDLSNLCTFSRDHQHQTFQFQLPDRLTDRCPAHTKLICQLDLHQSFSRF